jgi:predicted nucleic acid-binding protein
VASGDRCGLLSDHRVADRICGRARSLLADEQMQVVSHTDIEVASSLRRQVQRGWLKPDDGWRLLDAYRWMAVTRHGSFSMVDRIWQLRDNLTAYDAAYVALAEIIECPLVTADARLSRAPGLRCAVTVLPA